MWVNIGDNIATFIVISRNECLNNLRSVPEYNREIIKTSAKNVFIVVGIKFIINDSTHV